MPIFANVAEVEKVESEETMRQALENGKSVELTSNIELSKTITITKNDITIDINSKILSYKSSVAGEAIFTNRMVKGTILF